MSVLFICIILSFITSCGVITLCESAFAAEESSTLPLAGPQYKAPDEYHTPLGGEPLHTVFWGEKIDVPAMDRGNITALMLGATYYTPKQGRISGSPIGAFYLKRTWESSRTRNIISIFVNDLEYDKSFGSLELVTMFDSYTIPGGQTETLNNQEVTSSSIEWGNLIASMGPGLRYKVSPFQVDNDLKLQFLGRVGYAYTKRTSDTGQSTVLPPDTMLYGTKLRGRYDGLRRNLLELPHAGFAAGFDIDYMHRDKWADFGSTLITFKKSDTQDYFQYTGYLMGIGGIPGMSEKNRILVSIHGGVMDQKSVDRFNTFRIGGGPLPGESDDLNRPDYPGTMFNNVLVSQYLMAAVEYRRELTFFLYAHMRETFIWADRATILSDSQVGFSENKGHDATIGIDSGFLWNSSIYLDYSWDSGFIRNGKSGSGITLTWNKAF
jgi:hypothetical protein